MVILRYIKVYFLMMSQNLQASMEYKLDFFIGNLTTVLRQVVGISFIWVIFLRVGDLNGWTLPHIMVVYGLSALPLGIFELFFNGLWGLNGFIRMGTLDQYLSRPMGPLFYVISSDNAIHAFGDFITGFVILIAGTVQLGIRWSAGNVLFLILAVGCGAVIYVGINLATATMSFWFVGTRTAIMYVVHRLSDFSRYPIPIYAQPIRLLLSWIIPFAFTGFFPATFLLNITEYHIYVVLIPVVAVVFFFLTYGFWRIGLARYQSTGS